MAEKYPRANIVSVSNSQSQKAYIDAQAKARGFSNLTVRTADMNDFTMAETCDRVVSVEMFEHMANWQALLARVHGWLAPDGRAFIHVFAHRYAPYRFDHTDENDWIAKYFFTGGLMPSHGLMQHASDLFDVTAQWRWSGAHYQRTADHWLENFDRNLPAIRQILAGVYSKQASVWERRWRLFFLATAGLFGYARGEEWGVSHYLLAPKIKSE
jgi:cyclopropane-fatty-acyl-phospholipid synthase